VCVGDDGGESLPSTSSGDARSPTRFESVDVISSRREALSDLSASFVHLLRLFLCRPSPIPAQLH
jgi:hypothetical protein